MARSVCPTHCHNIINKHNCRGRSTEALETKINHNLFDRFPRPLCLLRCCGTMSHDRRFSTDVWFQSYQCRYDILQPRIVVGMIVGFRGWDRSNYCVVCEQRCQLSSKSLDCAYFVAPLRSTAQRWLLFQVEN